MLKNIIISLVVLTINSVNVQAQDYFIVGDEITECTDLRFLTTIQGFLKKISYIDNSGKLIEIEGRKNVPDVSTFYQDSVFYDKTPVKANKPNSYIRYTERAVDGKLKIYLDASSATMSGDQYNSYRFLIKMPNGVFYKINSKGNMKKEIKPYLLQCEEFKMQYKEDFSTLEEPFMEMIRLYNSLCQ
jgi:hypothetical protein